MMREDLSISTGGGVDTTTERTLLHILCWLAYTHAQQQQQQQSIILCSSSTKKKIRTYVRTGCERRNPRVFVVVGQKQITPQAGSLQAKQSTSTTTQHPPPLQSFNRTVRTYFVNKQTNSRPAGIAFFFCDTVLTITQQQPVKHVQYIQQQASERAIKQCTTASTAPLFKKEITREHRQHHGGGCGGCG